MTGLVFSVTGLVTLTRGGAACLREEGVWRREHGVASGLTVTSTLSAPPPPALTVTPVPALPSHSNLNLAKLLSDSPGLPQGCDPSGPPSPSSIASPGCWEPSPKPEITGQVFKQNQGPPIRPQVTHPWWSQVRATNSWPLCPRVPALAASPY